MIFIDSFVEDMKKIFEATPPTKMIIDSHILFIRLTNVFENIKIMASLHKNFSVYRDGIILVNDRLKKVAKFYASHRIKWILNKPNSFPNYDIKK